MKPITNKRGTVTSINDLGFSLNPRSGNKKTGSIAVSIHSALTCPPTCPFLDECYAASGPMRMHWQGVTDQVRTMKTQAKPLTWEEYLHALRNLKPGSLLRFASAGDLPSTGEEIMIDECFEMFDAASHVRSFTYTHFTTRQRDLETVAELNALHRNTTINLSANNDADVDRLVGNGSPVCVVTVDKPKVYTTPGGNRVVQCPATTDGSKVNCKTCGNGAPLCARQDRDYVIGFPVHGNEADKVAASGAAYRLPTAGKEKA